MISFKSLSYLSMIYIAYYKVIFLKVSHRKLITRYVRIHKNSKVLGHTYCDPSVTQMTPRCDPSVTQDVIQEWKCLKDMVVCIVLDSNMNIDIYNIAS